MAGEEIPELAEIGPVATALRSALEPSEGFFLTLAGVLIVCSIPLFLLHSWAWQLAGYVLAAPVPFGLVLVNRRNAIRRREREGIVGSRTTEVVAWVLLGVGFVVALLHGFAFAYEVSRR